MYIVDRSYIRPKEYTLSLTKVHSLEGLYATLNSSDDIVVKLTYNGGNCRNLKYFKASEEASKFIVNLVQSYQSNVQFFYMSEEAKEMFGASKTR